MYVPLTSIATKEIKILSRSYVSTECRFYSSIYERVRSHFFLTPGIVIHARLYLMPPAKAILVVSRSVYVCMDVRWRKNVSENSCNGM